MIGITDISTALGGRTISNLERLEKLGFDQAQMLDKLGFRQLARREEGQETSDLCVAAAQPIIDRLGAAAIQCLVVVGQNPDGHGLPHTSAIVHGRLGLPTNCAAFDISLGCSGFVYALSVVSAFMQANGLTCGLIITADPYSKVLDPEDRNTEPLFGDGAAAVLLTDQPKWRAGKFEFGTDGSQYQALMVGPEGKLAMNGRAVFNFSAQQVPKSIERVLALNGLTLDQIDMILLHQGSKYIVDTVGKRLGVADKTPFLAADTGNLVSSSIPFLLATAIPAEVRRLAVSGFGVGLSWATTILERC